MRGAGPEIQDETGSNCVAHKKFWSEPHFSGRKVGAVSKWADFRKGLLSLALTHWAEGIGLLFGLGMILLAFPLSEPEVKGAVVLASLSSLAAGAGAVAALRPDLKALTRSLATNHGARLGARTGLLAAVLGGGTIAAVTTFEGNPTTIKWLAAVMSILPSTLTGMIAGAWTAGLRAVPDPLAPNSIPPPEPRSWGWVVLAVHMILSGLGFLSPLFLHDFGRERRNRLAMANIPVAPARPVVAAEPKPVKVQEPPPPVVPATPPFVYEMEEGFKSAPVWRWEISRKETIPSLDLTHALAVSPDGTLLAWFEPSGGSGSINVLHLPSRRTIATSPGGVSVRDLEFAPESKRIVAVVNDSLRPLRIFDLESSRSFQLPRPAMAAIPDAPIRWWTEGEMAFFPSKDKPIPLELNTLRLGQPDSSNFWKAQTPEQKLAWSRDTGDLTGDRSWPYAILVPPLSYDESYPDRKEVWPVQEDDYFFALKDPKYPYQRVLHSVSVADGDRFVAPPDSGMVLHQHENQTSILYFRLRQAPKLCFKLEMPWPIADAPEGTALAEQIASHQLCAFICEPLVNPLNDKVIAPNRDKIKALVRFSDWKEQSAHLWIAEEYNPVADGDVIGDIHVWDGGKLKPAGPSIGQEWWAPLPKTAFTDEDPGLVAVTNRRELPGVSYDNGALVVSDSKSNLTRTAEAVPRPASVRESESLNEREEPDLGKSEPDDEDIRRFVHLHHEKAARGDVEGVVADYAEVVDHFSNGLVNRDFILRDETAYHAKLASQTEVVNGGILIIKMIEKNVYEARYPLKVRWTKANGESGGGVFGVELRVRMKGDSFEIIRHRSVKLP